MKTRTGFVSNSSSTSFCIVGVSSPYAQAIAKKMGLTHDDNSYGTCEFDDGLIAVFSNNGYSDEDEDENDASGSVELVGIVADEILENKSVRQAAEEFSEMIEKKYGIKIDPVKVGLHYGEASNE